MVNELIWEEMWVKEVTMDATLAEAYCGQGLLTPV